MRNIIKTLLFACCLVFCFMLGCMYTNLDTIYTQKNWDDNEKKFISMKIEEFVSESTTKEDYSLLAGKLVSILEDNNVITITSIDERKVISSSTGSFSSSEGVVEYTILRVNFTYINDKDMESDMFLYFYYNKVDYNEYSLMDVSTQDFVEIK